MASLFGQSYSFKVTETDGVPSGVADVKKEDLIGATVKALVATVQSDVKVVGIGNTLAEGIKIYAGANITRNVLGGGFALNPWSKAAA